MLIRLKSTGEYLDFNDDIEIEKQSKLFESIDSTAGDFSYVFELKNTASNRAKLGLPYVFVSTKTIYNNIEADIIDNDGIPLYSGNLRVEGINDVIECSFFSGNYNWMAMIDGDLTDLNLSEYDTTINVSNITASWSQSEGLVFPLVDIGGLDTRSYRTIVPQDFTGMMYVKTMFNKIFNTAGIKIQGELMNDWVYNNIVIAKNNKNISETEANTSYVQKSSVTSMPLENTDYKVTFQNDSVYPYFDGVEDSFDLPNSRYIAPYGMYVRVEVNLVFGSADPSYSNRLKLYINGVFTFVDIGLSIGGLYNTAITGNDELKYNRVILLQAGDILEVYSEWQQSGGSTPTTVDSGTIRITPVYLFEVKGTAVVPTWTKKEFVANVLNLFNVVTDFDPNTKTITFDFFDKIKSKTSIDISEYVKIVDTDFSEFISSYGRENIFSYSENGNERIKDYNITNTLKYGSGKVNIDNDFIPESVEVVSSDFTTPVTYLNTTFKCSLEKLDFIEMQESEAVEFTSVANSSGVARFITANNPFLIGDLVRITESNENSYVGDWRVSARDLTYFELQGVEFNESANGSASKITHTLTGNEDVFLLINIPNYSVGSFSELSGFNFPSAVNVVNTMSLAYFNVLQNGTSLNTGYLQGLSFGPINNEASYQKNLLQTYWKNFQGVLSDPVKIYCEANLPKSLFMKLTPLTPVYINTETSVNQYYINRISGFIKRSKKCIMELIKL